MKRISIFERIATILLTVIATASLIIAAEYFLIGKSTLKIAAVSFLIEHKYPGVIDTDNQCRAL
ncbi:MAG: hypothetical protein J1F64_10210, partial [Oscillospiraceae bacterium]|nr:hypothetical protein [Oscillospiraceae bacterium]